MNRIGFVVTVGSVGIHVCATGLLAWGTLAHCVISIQANSTLCPAPFVTFPSVIAGNRPGWGCAIFDTYMEDSENPMFAVTKASGDCVIGPRRWVNINGAGSGIVGFDYDNVGRSGAVLRAVHERCRNRGLPWDPHHGQRGLDGNGVAPNGDDHQWSFQ